MTVIKEKQRYRALIAFAVCLSLAHLLPLYTGPILIFYNDALTVLGVIIAVALVANEKIIEVQIPTIVTLPLGLAIVIVGQMLIGMVPVDSDAIYPIAYFLIAAMMVLLGASIAAKKQGASQICTALTYAYLLVGVMSVVIASIQFLGWEDKFSPFILQIDHDTKIAARPFANMGQPNQLALLFCFSLAAIWWLNQVSRLGNVGAIVIALITLWGLALTQSRIGWIIVPAFASLLFLWRKKPGFRKIPSWLIGCIVLSYLLMVVILPAISSFLIQVPTTSAMERIGTGSTSERLVLFQQALKISLLHPWLGAGWGEFAIQQQALAAGFSPSIHSAHAHNIVLNFAAELGWPLTIITFGFFSYWFYTGCMRRAINTEIGFAILFFMAVFVHSQVEFPLWYAYVLLPFALLVGMVHQEQFGSRVHCIPQVSLIACFLLMSVLFIGAAFDYRKVVVAFRAQAWGSLGIKVKGYAIDNRPNFTISSQFYDHLQFAKIEAHEKMSVEQIAFMEKVSHRFGYMPNLKQMALIYALNDQPIKAVNELLTIKQLFRCGYMQIYKEWGKRAKQEPQKFMNIFAKLPLPDPSTCK